MNLTLVFAALYAPPEGMTSLDLFSKDYFFNEQYAQHRSEVILPGLTKFRRSRLSILLREAMTDEKRAGIFDGKYQLGNKQQFPGKGCNEQDLADHLFGKGRLTNLDPKDALRAVKRGIQQITGITMREHFKTNRYTTLKVMYCLQKFMIDRKPRLFQFLLSPTVQRKYSHSFRDGFPYEKNQEQVWAIADLKAYLSAELTDDRFNDINIACNRLEAFVEVLPPHATDLILSKYRGNYEAMVSAYHDLAVELGKVKVDREKSLAPLDEILYTHLHMVERVHFYYGYPLLLKQAIPNISITPVWHDIRNLVKRTFANALIPIDELSEVFQIRDVPAVADRLQAQIIAIMEKAMNKRLEKIEFNQILQDGCALMKTEVFFGRNSTYMRQGDTANVSFLHMIAALCTAWLSIEEVPELEPYWHGKGTQGASLNRSNRLGSSSLFTSVVDNVPEEHRHFWAIRFKWFRSALFGQQKLVEQRFAVDSALARVAMQLCNMNNLGLIEPLFEKLSKLMNDMITNHQWKPRSQLGTSGVSTPAELA